MAIIEFPQPFRMRQLPEAALAAFNQRRALHTSADSQLPLILAASANSTIAAVMSQGESPPPQLDLAHLAGLVSEAVLEVVFVALPGFLVAVTGMFDANSQRFVAQLNTMVFTPCLVFTKLASQLNAEKLSDLLVIPFIFVAQTLVSWVCAQLMAWAFGFQRKDKKMQKNFILAMGVFGNSNSLPISLVLSLSKTISGLHWDQLPGDNDDEVAARGILYLLIFQQLGQLLRWTWGYNVLLKPKSAYEEDELPEGTPDRLIEEGSYTDNPVDEVAGQTSVKNSQDSGFSSGAETPDNASAHGDVDHRDEIVPATSANGNNIEHEPNNLINADSEDDASGADAVSIPGATEFPNFFKSSSDSDASKTDDWLASIRQLGKWASFRYRRTSSTISVFFHNLFRRLPSPVQKALSFLHYYNVKFWSAVWNLMNPPLWAMLVALLVASIPRLQHLFFDKGTFVSNSITRAVEQSGGVAVPLVLVVLGANLARSTLPQDQLATSPGEKREERKLLFASILSRMVLPTIIMAPLLAIVAKWAPVSILDDPIFIIVCFLLTGAPSALQLAQICQINGVFMGAMSSLLVASYVVAIFPSTLLLVLMALEVVHWAVI